MIVGYGAIQVTTASLKRERRGLGAGLPADCECATAAFNASRNRQIGKNHHQDLLTARHARNLNAAVHAWRLRVGASTFATIGTLDTCTLDIRLTKWL